MGVLAAGQPGSIVFPPAAGLTVAEFLLERSEGLFRQCERGIAVADARPPAE